MIILFFFSSRRRHTRFDCDWSSDVCSSDLTIPRGVSGTLSTGFRAPSSACNPRCRASYAAPLRDAGIATYRSEERRVGKECRSGWAADDYIQKWNGSIIKIYDTRVAFVEEL